MAEDAGQRPSRGEAEREGEGGRRVLRVASLSSKDRYELLTSLVVPRPIGWLSTYSPDRVANLAPFSYFGALASTPMLVGASIGHRGREPKDTLRNVRTSAAFCANIVTEAQLDAMNLTSGEYPPEVDEFHRAGLSAREADSVRAPFVSGCPAVLECALFKEVALGDAPNTLLIGEVLRIRLLGGLRFAPGSLRVETESLRPVGRLTGATYGLIGEIRSLPRPG